MASDDDLRERLTQRTQEELFSEYDREYDTTHLNLGHFRLEAERIIDALMPVVREALASARANAWDQGAEAAYEWQIGITGKPDNPWREGD